MKLFIRVFGITVFVFLFLLALPYILPKKKMPKYSDDELREVALSRGMKPVPSTYKELLKVVDNPENPLSVKKILLGKELFFDTLLSKDKDISCASCHILQEGGDDNIPAATGYRGRVNPFHLNSPTVLNSALAKAEFWNGRAKDVEEQAGGPIQAPFEMNMTPKEVVERLKKVPSYKTEFQDVFAKELKEGEDAISFKNVKKAIGAYERTLLTRGDYDRFLEGDNLAMSKKAKKGLAHFINYGCKGCHTGMSVGGQSLQKFPLRGYIDWLNISVLPDIKLKNQGFPFENTGGFLGKDDHKLFRVPILRNITKTAPYFHNGAVKDLKEVIRIMGKHQIGVDFTKEEVEDILAFFKTLEGKIVDYKIGESGYQVK